jgi:hypothetical protein
VRRVLWKGIIIRFLTVLLVAASFGVLKLPIERSLSAQHKQAYFRGVELGLDLREQIGQLGFLAALSGFRSLVADVLFIQAHVAWERTEWGRVLLLFRQVTTLQPRGILFLDMAAWHMAWNASVAALNDRTQPREALRIKAQREYLALGKNFLERGIRNNPDRPQLYEALARLYKENIRTTNGPPNILKKPRSSRTRPVMKKDSPRTNFLIVTDASARHTAAYTSFTAWEKTSDCRP